MKNIVFLIAVSLFLSVFAQEQGKRIIKVDGTPQEVKNLEIVVPESSNLLDFSALELQTFLTKTTGQKIAIVKTPTNGTTSLILGDNTLSKAAGLDISKLSQEGYYISRKGNRIYLAGKDSVSDAPGQNRWSQS